MAVRPDARGRGLGAALVRALVEAARTPRLWLQVLASNAPARGLYERAGFAPAFAHHYRVRDAG